MTWDTIRAGAVVVSNYFCRYTRPSECGGGR